MDISVHKKHSTEGGETLARSHPSTPARRRGESAGRQRRTQEQRRKETREALISAAVDVICEAGYASTTTNMIADRAGVTRGAMQYHFESRDDLVLAVTDSIMTDLNFRLDSVKLSALALEDRIDALIAQYRAVFAGPQYHAAIQILLGARNDPALFARMQMHLKSAQDAIDRTWHDIFPEFRLPSHQLAGIRRITMAAIRGYVLLELIGGAGAWGNDSGILRDMVAQQLKSGIEGK